MNTSFTTVAYLWVVLIYQVDTLHFIPAISNIAAAFIGNYIGGGLIIGLFYAYLNDHHQFYKNN